MQPNIHTLVKLTKHYKIYLAVQNYEIESNRGGK